jgi:hypothetical protein
MGGVMVGKLVLSVVDDEEIETKPELIFIDNFTV